MAAVGRKPDPDERLALSLANATTAAAVHYRAGVFLICGELGAFITPDKRFADLAIGDLIGEIHSQDAAACDCGCGA